MLRAHAYHAYSMLNLKSNPRFADLNEFCLSIRHASNVKTRNSQQLGNVKSQAAHLENDRFLNAGALLFRAGGHVPAPGEPPEGHPC